MENEEPKKRGRPEGSIGPKRYDKHLRVSEETINILKQQPDEGRYIDKAVRNQHKRDARRRPTPEP